MAAVKNNPRIGRNKRYHQPGTAPGTLVAWPEASADCARITLIQYTSQDYRETVVKQVHECWEQEKDGWITWINLEGLCDTTILREIGGHYHLHPLALEDVLNTGQRPKWESYPEHDFVIMHLIADKSVLEAHQVAIFLGRNFLITIEETEGQAFEMIRERLRQSVGQIRNMGSDFLCYSICDTLVDQFFPVLERVGEKLDDIEDALVASTGTQVAPIEIHRLKRELLFITKIAWAEREVINALQREESRLVHPEIAVYLRDCYDHTVQVIDMIENLRDISTGILDSYLSSISNQMNAVMKILTVIATIFIPLTFIVGIYGMNFRNMPELHWRFGYLAVWVVMILIAGGMVIIFRNKKWI
jgi:magnesium transporter